LPALLERLRGLVQRDREATSAVVKLGPFGSYNALSWNYLRLSRNVYGHPVGYRCIEIIGNNFCRPTFEVRKPGTQEPLESHELLDALNHPERRAVSQGAKPGQMGRSGTNMQRTWSRDLELNGRSFWVLMQGRDGLGNTGPVTGFKRLIPQRVTVVANMEDELLGFIYQPRAGGRMALLPEALLYLRFPHPEREFDGMPPALVAGLAAEVDMGAARFNADLLSNDAGMPGYLVVEGLSRDKFREWKASWDAGEYPGKIRFLGPPGQGGKATFVRTAMTNQELTYHELRMDSQDDMCYAFGVPKVLLNPSDTTFTNQNTAMLGLWRYNVLPKWTIVADDLTIQLGEPLGVEVGVNLDDIEELQEAEDAKVQRASTLLQLDAIVINEWREDQGLDPLPWGDYALSFLRQLTAPAAAGIPAELSTQIMAGMGGGVIQPTDEAIQKALQQRRQALRQVGASPALLALTKAYQPRVRLSKAVTLEVPQLEMAAVPAIRTKDGRLAHWRRWDRRVRSHEAVMSRRMRRFLDRQRRVTVARLRAAGSKSLSKALAASAWWDEARWTRELAEEAKTALADVVDSFGAATADQFGADWDPEADDVTGWVDANGDRIGDQVNKSTFRWLSGLITDRLASGDTLSALADAVDSWFADRADSRPDTIATIEVVPAANAGGAFAAVQASAAQDGYAWTKMWVTAGDDQVDEECDSHDGEEVDLADDFDGGDVPGDVHMGCRCTTVYLRSDAGDGDDSGPGGGDGGSKAAPFLKYSPSQSRDQGGKFADEGGGQSASSSTGYASTRQLNKARRLAMETAKSAPVPTEADRQAHEERVARSNRQSGDDRGSSKDRAARSEFLVDKFGDGEQCPCVYCGRVLTADTVSADRIYPGAEGGRYIRANVIPACRTCNSSRQAGNFFDLARVSWGKIGKVA
jgi:phage portal protein BeeE